MPVNMITSHDPSEWQLTDEFSRPPCALSREKRRDGLVV